MFRGLRMTQDVLGLNYEKRIASNEAGNLAGISKWRAVKAISWLYPEENNHIAGFLNKKARILF